MRGKTLKAIGGDKVALTHQHGCIAITVHQHGVDENSHILIEQQWVSGKEDFILHPRRRKTRAYSVAIGIEPVAR